MPPGGASYRTAAPDAHLLADADAHSRVQRRRVPHGGAAQLDHEHPDALDRRRSRRGGPCPVLLRRRRRWVCTRCEALGCCPRTGRRRGATCAAGPRFLQVRVSLSPAQSTSGRLPNKQAALLECIVQLGSHGTHRPWSRQIHISLAGSARVTHLRQGPLLLLHGPRGRRDRVVPHPQPDEAEHIHLHKYVTASGDHANGRLLYEVPGHHAASAQDGTFLGLTRQSSTKLQPANTARIHGSARDGGAVRKCRGAPSCPPPPRGRPPKAPWLAATPHSQRSAELPACQYSAKRCVRQRRCWLVNNLFSASTGAAQGAKTARNASIMRLRHV